MTHAHKHQHHINGDAERPDPSALAIRRVGLWVADGGAGAVYGDLSDGIVLVPYTTRGIHALLVVAPDLGRPGLGPELQRLRATQPDAPCILTTTWTPANLRWLKDIAVDDVIAPDELRSELRATVEKLVAVPILERLVSAIAGARNLPPDLRRALAIAMRHTPPVHTVQRRAWMSGLPRSRLFKLWRRHAGGNSLSAFLNTIMVVRLLDCVKPGCRVAGIVEHVGITRRTAERLVRRYSQRSLAQAAKDPHEPRAILEEALHRVIRQLVCDGAPRPSSFPLSLPHALARPRLAARR